MSTSETLAELVRALRSMQALPVPEQLVNVSMSGAGISISTPSISKEAVAAIQVVQSRVKSPERPNHIPAANSDPPRPALANASRPSIPMSDAVSPVIPTTDVSLALRSELPADVSVEPSPEPPIPTIPSPEPPIPIIPSPEPPDARPPDLIEMPQTPISDPGPSVQATQDVPTGDQYSERLDRIESAVNSLIANLQTAQQIELPDVIEEDESSDGEPSETLLEAPHSHESFTPSLIPDTPEESFWAKITGNSAQSYNWWLYSFEEVEKTATGRSGWTAVSGGRTGSSAMNTIEVANDNSGVQGNGVDVAHLDTDTATFSIMPCTTDNIVRMYELDANGTTEYWFSYENGVDGECD